MEVVLRLNGSFLPSRSLRCLPLPRRWLFCAAASRSELAEHPRWLLATASDRCVRCVCHSAPLATLPHLLSSPPRHLRSVVVMSGRMLGSVRGAPPSLKHFVLRSQVLSLYRKTLRLSRRCSSSEQRVETCAHARQQIEAMRGAQETHHIKLLLSEGRQQLESFETMLNMTR